MRGDSANAFSVPGGNIYVNEPLLRLAKNRDELAGVLAHETGHMVLHHVAQRMAALQKKSTVASIGSILAQIVLGPLAGAAVDYGSQYAVAGSDAAQSRHIEAQADEEGARIMAATGQFNPWGMVWFFQMMTETYGPGRTPGCAIIRSTKRASPTSSTSSGEPGDVRQVQGHAAERRRVLVSSRRLERGARHPVEREAEVTGDRFPGIRLRARRSSARLHAP